MALEQVRLGTPPSGSDGDDPRTAFTRINNNSKFLDDCGLTGPVTRSATDCNVAVQPGWWNCSGGSVSNRPPGMSYPYVLVVESESPALMQIAVDAATGYLASRGRPSNGQWSKWREVPPHEAPTVTTDLNSISETGSYAYIASTGNIPYLGQGYVFHIQHSNLLYASQEAIALDGITTARRVKQNGTWSKWRQGYAQNNVVGTVAIAGDGVPVGALIERGSNTNGRYTKFADGTMICEGYVTIPAQAMSTDAGATATFSAPFSSQPRVIWCPVANTGSGSQADVGLLMYNGTYMTISNSSWRLNSYSYRSGTSQPTMFSYIAYGRWYEA
ncbi:pyocin knob domain-containing protein [Pseudomonas soli]|uniref:pyocin knob domain-containing protein n=1 Tax=Pseudomonas soli TaxID=1306993 RepID=UPI0028AA2FEA|nr:pyocin knob domain-containing protein [Pseudomonas soli]